MPKTSPVIAMLLCAISVAPISGTTTTLRAVLPYTFTVCDGDSTVDANISTIVITHDSSSANGGIFFEKIVLQGGEGTGHGGAIEGVPYQINGKLQSNTTIDHADGSRLFIDQYSVELIGQGRAPNYVEKIWIHTKLDSDGRVTVVVDNSKAECSSETTR